jgi:hypothetical protein
MFLTFESLRQWGRAGALAIGLLLSLLSMPLAAQDKSRKKLPFIISKPDRYIFFPLIVKSPEYRWGAGTGGIVYFKLKDDSTTRTSSTKLVSFVTLRKQLVIASEGFVYFPDETFIIHYGVSVTHFPDKFWGIGNETPASAEEHYTISQYDLYPQVFREVRPNLFVGIGYEFQNVFYVDYDSAGGQSLFDKEDINGRYGSKISGTGIIVTWDTRNNAFSSNSGTYIQYFNNFYRDFLGSDYNFVIQSLDTRKYFKLRKSRSLAFQFIMTYVTGDMPIRNYSIMGSDSYMRGYYQGRFQDRAMAAMQSEFRTPVYKRFGMIAFMGMGRVGPTVSQTLVFSRLKPSFGVGFRYAINQKAKLNLRFDVGFGNRSHGSYLNMSEAF